MEVDNINHKEYQRIYQKKWYPKRLEKVRCTCGNLVSYNGLYTHRKRSVHRKLIQKIEENIDVVLCFD